MKTQKSKRRKLGRNIIIGTDSSDGGSDNNDGRRKTEYRITWIIRNKNARLITGFGCDDQIYWTFIQLGYSS
jgi:hypothetical protein